MNKHLFLLLSLQILGTLSLQAAASDQTSQKASLDLLPPASADFAERLSKGEGLMFVGDHQTALEELEAAHKAEIATLKKGHEKQLKEAVKKHTNEHADTIEATNMLAACIAGRMLLYSSKPLCNDAIMTLLQESARELKIGLSLRSRDHNGITFLGILQAIWNVDPDDTLKIVKAAHQVGLDPEKKKK